MFLVLSDAVNNVVFCRKCGFAVRVDPQTGETTPLSAGGPQATAPVFYQEKTILGTDPLTFLMGGTALLLVLTLAKIVPDLSYFVILEIILLFVYLKMK